MKNDLEIREAVRAAIDDCTRGIDEAPSLRLRVLQKAKGEPPVKKKFTAAMALAIALILLTSSALAATLLKPDILSWLFRGEEAPEEMQSLVQPNGITRQTENAAFTLNETFFDGEKLTVSLTLLNPTDEPLVYTIHHAKLNDKALVFETAQLPYGNSVGQALGGEVNGTPIPRETTFFVTFNGTDDPDDGLTPFVQKKPLQPMAEATISIRVDVFRPLVEYTPVSEIEFYSGKYDIITDLVPLYPETAWVNMSALLHPAKLKIVDHLDFSFPISLNEPQMTTVSAVPGEYKSDLYTLSLDSFTLKSSGGKMEGRITHIPDTLSFLAEQSFLSVFPEDVFEQAKAENNHALGLRFASFSSGCSAHPETGAISHFRFDADFRSVSGTLPKGVYLVWLDDHQTYWDSALYIPLLPQ